MTIDSGRLKHLEIIQQVITRMRIAKSNDRLIQEHVFHNNGRAIAAHNICFSEGVKTIIGTIKDYVIIFIGQIFIFLD